MTIGKASQKLKEEELDVSWIKTTAAAILFHVLGKIGVNILEHKCESFTRVNDVVKCDDVVVFKFFEKARLAYGSKRCSLLFLKSDFLQSDNLVGQMTETLEHCGVRAFS